MVHGEEYYPPGLSLGGSTQCDSRHRVSSHERQIRLDAPPTCVQRTQHDTRSDADRPVRLTTHESISSICELEAGSRGDGNRRLLNRLDTVPTSICEPTMEPSGESPDHSQGTTGQIGNHHASMGNTDVVPCTTVDGNKGATPTPTTARPDPGDTQGQPTRDQPTTSRVGYLRDKFRSSKLSEDTSDLLLASWRQKSSKTYDSLFSKWVSWCNQRKTDPISGDIAEVANFLTDLFHQGYQYRSLNAYRSAISSVHDKVDGHDVGQHPLISRLLKGAFNTRPPQPRYASTWNVATVTAYLDRLGANEKISLTDLTHKTAMLMALVRPCRSADLANLNINFKQFSPEGVTFFPTKLAKQSRPGKEMTTFFFPAFPHNDRLCPVQALRVLELRTSERRKEKKQSSLFLALIKPYNPVAPSTIARWLKSILSKAGIDTSTFKAHSIRGASTSSAANAGITTSDILAAADWSSETVFRKFYYRPDGQKSEFGSAVLSTVSQQQS